MKAATLLVSKVRCLSVHLDFLCNMDHLSNSHVGGGGGGLSLRSGDSVYLVVFS